MSKTSIQIIHNFLINENFFPVTKRDESFHYQGTLTISGYDFILELSFNDLDFIKTPIARVISWPDGLPKTLPHVYEGSRLCYIDGESINLDRYDPYSSFHIILVHIKEVLKSFLPKNHKNLPDEFADEFTMYWNRDSLNQAYIRSFEKSCVASVFDKENITEPDSELAEVLLHDENDTEQLTHWLKQRNVIEPNPTNLLSGEKPNGSKRLCDVIIVDLRKPCLIPVNSSWPPNSTEELLAWVNEIDLGTANHLAHRIEETIYGSNKFKKNKKIKKRSQKPFKKQLHKLQLSIFIVLSTQSGHIGVRIEFNKTTASIIANNFGRNKNTGRRSLLNILSSVNSKKIKNIIDKEETINSKEKVFARYSISDATDSRIITRNLVAKDSLLGKKIAIIGCGTIGGYAALLLNQTGAGVKDNSNRGCLHLYDADLLSIDNIGRHVLNLSYVGLNKAKSIEHFLLSRSFTEKTEIIGYSNIFTLDRISKLKKHDYDLIIDLSGSDVFSTALNHYIHTLEKEIPVLYAANYLGGKAVRTLLDDGNGACYRCMRSDNEKNLYLRYPLLKKGIQPPQPITRQCGATYFPYASSSSTACASLIQQLSLDFFSGNPSPRFRHLSLSSEIIYTKNQNPTKVANCQCCNT